MCKREVRLSRPSCAKNCNWTQALPSPILHPRDTAPPPNAVVLTQHEWPKKKKKTQGHRESMDTSQGWQSFNNLGLEKLYKYIIKMFQRGIIISLLLRHKRSSVLTPDGQESIRKSVLKDVLSNPKQAKSWTSCYLDNAKSTQRAEEIKCSFFPSSFYLD